MGITLKLPEIKAEINLPELPKDTPKDEAFKYAFDKFKNKYGTDHQLVQALGDRLHTSGLGATIGGIAGAVAGTVGGAFTAPFTAGIVNPYTLAAALSAAGSGGGEALEQWYTGKGDTEDVGEEALLGLAGGVAGVPLLRGPASSVGRAGLGLLKRGGRLAGDVASSSLIGASTAGGLSRLTGIGDPKELATAGGIGGAIGGIGLNVFGYAPRKLLTRFITNNIGLPEKVSNSVITDISESLAKHTERFKAAKAVPTKDEFDSLYRTLKDEAISKLESKRGSPLNQTEREDIFNILEDAVDYKAFRDSTIEQAVGTDLEEAANLVSRDKAISNVVNSTKSNADRYGQGLLEYKPKPELPEVIELGNRSTSDISPYGTRRADRVAPRAAHAKDGVTVTIDGKPSQITFDDLLGGKSKFNKGGAIANKARKVYNEGYTAPGQAYAIAKNYQRRGLLHK